MILCFTYTPVFTNWWCLHVKKSTLSCIFLFIAQNNWCTVALMKIFYILVPFCYYIITDVSFKALLTSRCFEYDDSDFYRLLKKFSLPVTNAFLKTFLNLKKKTQFNLLSFLV